jgi:hypothetical protein
MHEYVIKKVSDLVPYINNSRTHSEEQTIQIASSISEFGFTNPVLIDDTNNLIAGHGRLLAAKKLGLEEVPAIVLTGLSKAQKKAYVIADNQLALNSGWDLDMLKIEIEGLKELDFDIGLLGFEDDFLNDLIDLHKDDSGEGGEDNPYTSNVESPAYEPVGDKPDIESVFDAGKTNKLLSEIEQSNIPENEKQFLRAAAYRHTVINFESAANYYAHSEALTQRLFEDSALVIIDFDKAIEDGYIKLSDEMRATYMDEKVNDK